MSTGFNINGTNPPLVTTYNILLEYGEFDLEEYFRNRLPPSLQKEILSFWTNMLAIAKQVGALHKFERRGGTRTTRFYG